MPSATATPKDTSVLENEHLHLSVSALGAELRSLRHKPDQTELLWQADPAFWPRTAPILFPVVGRLKNNTYTYKGASYQMPQHGFARDCSFLRIESTSSEVTYQLESSPYTQERYPFAFRLQIRYTLDKNCLYVHYSVYNPARDAMYFSLGAHPGFTCLPGGPGQVKAQLRMDMARYHLLYRLEQGLLQTEPTEGLLTSLDGIIDLTDELIENDAMVFLQPLGRWVDLYVPGRRQHLRLQATGWPNFGIWSKEHAPFVCLEPWYGHADFADTTQELTAKAGIIELKGGKTWEANWSVEVRLT